MLQAADALPLFYPFAFGPLLASTPILLEIVIDSSGANPPTLGRGDCDILKATIGFHLPPRTLNR